MLSEIAISLCALKAALAETRLDWVRELELLLLPRASDVPIAICSDSGGRWKSEVAKAICKIQDSSRKHAAQSLFLKLESELMFVSRHLQTQPDLSNEDRWFDCLDHAETGCEIMAYISMTPERSKLRFAPHEIREDYFDRLAKAQRDIPCTKEKQDEVMKSFLSHSDFLDVRFPQIRGGEDDELFTVRSFATQMSKCSRLNSGCRILRIHLNPSAILEHTIESLKVEIGSWRLKNLAVQIRQSSKKFINREVLAGEFVYADNQLFERPRWHLTMQHVATQRRHAETFQNTWVFFGFRKAHKRYVELNDSTSKLLFETTY